MSFVKRCLIKDAFFLMVILCISFIALPSRVLAIKPIIYFDHLTIADGLSQGSVTAILQDRFGFMWFGTQDGLNRYDGYHFKVYKNIPFESGVLSNSWIQCLLEDRDGFIWIGTHSGGVFKFNRFTEKFTRYAHEADNPHSLSHNQIWTLFQDSEGTLWVGSSGGLDRFDEETGQFTQIKLGADDSLPVNRRAVNAIAEDSLGNLWIGTFGDGLFYFDRRQNKFEHFKHHPDDPTSLSNNYVKCLLFDKDGTLWIGTWGGGLNRFDSVTGQFSKFRSRPGDPKSLSNDIVMSLLQDRNGAIWIGTHRGGLNKFDPVTETFTVFRHDPLNPQSLSHDWVPALCEDNSGILWIGTGEGISKYNHRKNEVYLFQHNPKDPNSLSNNIVNAVFEDRDRNLWIGTWGGGLNKYDSQSGTFQRFTYDAANPFSLSSNIVWDICQDPSGHLWVATSQGLDQFDVSTGRVNRYTHLENDPASVSHNNISVVYADHEGNIWIGTWGKGLDMFSPRIGQFHHFPAAAAPEGPSDGFITSICEDHLGRLWIGTVSGGLNLLEKNDTSGSAPRYIFSSFQYDPQNREGISHNHITTICEDSSYTLWIGTKGGGLNRFNPATRTFDHFTEENGLSDNLVRSLLSDSHGHLWIATAKRITIFDLREKTFRNFTASDVFDNIEFQGGACKLRSGEMIFASTQGFIRFHPDSVEFGNYHPPVRITSFQVFNKEVPLERPIYQNPPLRLSYKDDFFSFEFSSLDFRNPAKNRYAYMMEGFDSDWIYTDTKNFVTYTNLDPGEYIFKVKGTNSDGVWNPTFTAIPIYISPPFWDTAWFKILASITLLLLLVSSYQWRTQRMKNEQRKLERLVAEKTNQLKEKNLQLREINRNQSRLIEEREKLIAELQEAMGKIKTLSGLLPICSHCKKVRDDSGYWKSIELYITEHSEADFSHGICPDCAKKLYPEIYDKDDRDE